jgi:hypothetical protein
MAALDPLTLTAAGDLACATCGEPVTGILMPLSARLRPRAVPDASEIIADVIVGTDATLQPCGHPYQTDDLPSRRMGEARPEA